MTQTIWKTSQLFLKTNKETKVKKIEYLIDLIRDEFRIDYLNSKTIKKKVTEIYEKYDEFLSNMDEKLSTREISKSWSENNSQNTIQMPVFDMAPYEEQKVVELKVPKTLFTGPDEKNHHDVENKLHKLLNTAKSKVYIWSYTIGNGVLSVDVAKILKKRWGNNFKIITDQMQMTNKNLKKYCNDLLDWGILIKKNNNAKNLMHCKFIVIDDEFVVHGSMNLGEKSLKNYEHLTISSELKTINQFSDRFEAMWTNGNRFSDCINDDDINSNSWFEPIFL